MTSHSDNDALDSVLSEEAIATRIREEECLAMEHARRAEGWRLILRGRQFLTGNVTAALSEAGAQPRSDGPSDRPSNTEAILRIVASEPHRPWRPSEILKALAERGWLPRGKTPRKTMGATLSNLVKSKQLERVARGQYTLPLLGVPENEQRWLGEKTNS